MKKFLPVALVAVAVIIGAGALSWMLISLRAPTVVAELPLSPPLSEKPQIPSTSRTPAAPLNPDGFVLRSSEATELDDAERELLANLRSSDRILVEPTVFVLNRAALSGGAIVFTTTDGRQFQYVGSPVPNWPRLAWTGVSTTKGGLVLDSTEQGLVGEITEDGISYTMSELPGGRHAVVSKMSKETFYEPPDMSGHPPFPRGATGERWSASQLTR